MKVVRPTKNKGRAQRARRVTRPLVRTLPTIVRRLRSHLPELRKKYHVKSLGVFGSYVRGDQKPRSDLDVLVEFDEAADLLSDFFRLQEHLSELLGVNIDLVENGHLKPYIGKRILREVIWLQKDNVPLRVRLPRRPSTVKPNGKRNGGAMEPKREYLDYLEDILKDMAKAQRHIAGMSYEQMLADEKTLDAVERTVERIGEAAWRVPFDVRERHPEIPWNDIIAMRHLIAHGYDAINYETVRNILHESIQRDQPLVAAMLFGWAAWHALYGRRHKVRFGMQVGLGGLFLWSFLMANAHGAGLMLVPAVIPLCLAASPTHALTVGTSLPIAFAALGVHTAAMLASWKEMALPRFAYCAFSSPVCSATSFVIPKKRRLRMNARVGFSSCGRMPA